MAAIRLYQDIRFDRELKKGIHTVSPGGYEITFLMKDGSEKTASFDFHENEGGITGDRRTASFTSRDLDYDYSDEMPDLRDVACVKSIGEWRIETDSDDEGDIPVPAEITEALLVDVNGDVPGEWIEVKIDPAMATAAICAE